MLGGTLGLGFAYVALRVLVAIAPAYLPRLENISLDPLVIAFTLGISLVAGLLFGLIPVFKYATPKGNLTLRGGGRSLSHSKERHRARNTLVVVQTALAVVLLISAGLMIRTFQALRHVHPGFTAAAQLQTFRIDIAEGQVKEPERVLRMQQEIRRKIAEIPGVSSVSFANSVPTDGNNSTDVLYAEDRVYAEGQVPPLRRFKFVTPDFFQTMGTPADRRKRSHLDGCRAAQERGHGFRELRARTLAFDPPARSASGSARARKTRGARSSAWWAMSATTAPTRRLPRPSTGRWR